MAAWCIGKFGEDCLNDKIFKKCLLLLKDKFWKVRTSACITIGCLGIEAIEEALPQLLDILKDGTVNRIILCETIIKMGTQGERILVEVLKRMRVKDSKLICPIIHSLELSNIFEPSIDFVIEELINSAKSPNGQIRASSYSSLLKIKKRSQGQSNASSYLSFDSLIDIFILGMKDPIPKNRDVGSSLTLSYVKSS